MSRGRLRRGGVWHSMDWAGDSGDEVDLLNEGSRETGGETGGSRLSLWGEGWRAVK